MAQPCRCGCGEMVNGTWKRGHHRRAAVRVVPNPPASSAATAPAAEDEWWQVQGSQPPAAGEGAGPLPGDGPGEGAGARPFWEVPDEPGPDPDPGYMTAPTPAPAPADAFDVPVKVRRDIAGMLSLFIMLPADLIVMLDPYCGDAFMRAAPNMVKSLVPIICQSEAAVDFIVRQKGLLLWANFFLAAKPFLSALIAHHVTKRVAVDRGEHGPQVRTTDYSQYSAA